MTEIDYLKCKLEDTEKAFDKLHERHIELLKQQGKLEKENEKLKKEHKIAIDEMVSDYKNLEKENEQLQKVCLCLKKENQSLIENIFDIYEKVKWVVR